MLDHARNTNIGSGLILRPTRSNRAVSGSHSLFPTTRPGSSEDDTRSLTANQHSHLLPRLAITVGDLAGVGPELAMNCAGMPAVRERCQPILYGPRRALDQISARLNLNPCCQIREVGDIDLATLEPGSPNAATGRASYDAVNLAIDDAIANRVEAIVTGPIQKEAWHAAGIRFPGHTELLAERTGVEDFCMMLTSPEISCVLATIHIPLADVPKQLTQTTVARAIHLAADAMHRQHGRAGRITVCGLNPHAGEKGLFGHGEEEESIEPAIRSARRQGLDIRGPLPPDTAFTPKIRHETDAYVCMYHDQGLIPLKALSFDDAVNVTLGLPIVRTSVDHGTALDLAWQGKARHHSMLAAIDMAIDLSRNRLA